MGGSQRSLSRRVGIVTVTAAGMMSIACTPQHPPAAQHPDPIGAITDRGCHIGTLTDVQTIALNMPGGGPPQRYRVSTPVRLPVSGTTLLSAVVHTGSSTSTPIWRATPGTMHLVSAGTTSGGGTDDEQRITACAQLATYVRPF